MNIYTYDEHGNLVEQRTVTPNGSTMYRCDDGAPGDA
jgi:hypothetical protein